MKNSEVVIGEKYIAKVSGRLTVVKVTAKGYPKGWCAKNLATDREVSFRTAGRLRRLATTGEVARKRYGFCQKPVEHRPL